MSDIIVNCKECKKPFPTDAKWKDTCYQCYLKSKNPKRYKESFEMDDITCERCKKKFTDEPWKTLCAPCWLKDKHEKEQIDLEEREQFDD